MKPSLIPSLLSAGLVAWCGLGLMDSAALAQSRPEPPDLLLFEGHVVGGDGAVVGTSKPVNYPVVFRVFDRPVGGQLLWSEQQTVSVFQGAFSALLGEGNSYANEPRPPLSSIFRSSTASDRYVEVTLRAAGAGTTDVTVAPRTRLAVGAFSLLATHARTAQDLVNRNGQQVLTPVEDRVGINRSNPSATLDVAGSFQATGVEVSGAAGSAGTVDAKGFHGLGMAPVGSIVMWTGSTPPRGWVLCDGSVVSGVATPDLRGRFVLGAGPGPGLTARTQGQVGGAESHTLSANEMPAHGHLTSFSGSASNTRLGYGGHDYRMAMGSADALNDWGRDASYPNPRIGTANTTASGSHRHSLDIAGFQSSASGEGRPHSNIPPFYVLAFIMRVP